MKSLMSGCAAAALLVCLAAQAHAQTTMREAPVRDAPVHAVPMDEDDAPAAEPAAPVADKAEPAPVKALTLPKAPPAPTLTPQEDAFFAALGQRVTDAASAYENYVRRAGGIDPAFKGSASVQRAVKLGAAYHPHQLEEGIVAYAALIAAGKAVTKAAYDIQTQSWSKSPVADPRGVLDAAETSGDETRTATVPSKARLLDSLMTARCTEAPPLKAGSMPPARRT